MMSLVMAAAFALSTHAPGPALPSWEEVVAVPPELHAQFDAQVLQETRGSQQRVQQIVEFMLDPEGLALEYDLETTRTVAETFHDRRGNCVSFTLTFVALAREAGLDAYVQEADQALLWLQDESTQGESMQDESMQDGVMMFYAGHVNAGVRIRGRRFVVDFDRSVVATAAPPTAITDRRALAHYYNNRGAEWLTAGEFPAAHSFFEAAIELEPDFVPAWNNLGVLGLRSGDTSAAERAYLAALEREPKHVPTLSNLAGLYRQLGEQEKLTRYQRRLDDVQRRDPFRSFILGLQHERQGDDPLALEYYLRAIRMHRGEPQFHLAVARIYDRLGEPGQAQRSLARARALGDNSARDVSRTGFRVRN